MSIEAWREERIAAVEAWQSALSAYEIEAERHFSSGLREAIRGLPNPRQEVDESAISRLLALRAAEELAMRRYLDVQRARPTHDDEPTTCPGRIST